MSKKCTETEQPERIPELSEVNLRTETAKITEALEIEINKNKSDERFLGQDVKLPDEFDTLSELDSDEDKEHDYLQISSYFKDDDKPFLQTSLFSFLDITVENKPRDSILLEDITITDIDEDIDFQNNEHVSIANNKITDYSSINIHQSSENNSTPVNSPSRIRRISANHPMPSVIRPVPISNHLGELTFSHLKNDTPVLKRKSVQSLSTPMSNTVNSIESALNKISETMDEKMSSFQDQHKETSNLIESLKIKMEKMENTFTKAINKNST